MKKRLVPIRSLCYAAVGIALGVLSKWQQHQQPTDPIVQACTSIEYQTLQDFVDATRLQPYDLRFGAIVGDATVCITTQKLYHSSTAGYLVYGLQLLLQFPVLVLTYVEAGRRSHPNSILLWPTTFYLLYYFLGTSVVFSSVWLTAYCCCSGGCGRTEPPQEGSTASTSTLNQPQRGLVALLVAVPSLLLYCNTLLFHRDSTIYHYSVGLLGSPLLALLPLLGSSVPPTTAQVVPVQQPIRNAKNIATAYAIMGCIGFVGWMLALYTYLTRYGSNTAKFWTDASNDSVSWVELWSLGMGWIVWLAFRSEWSALEAVLLTPLLGPGAAVALEMATLELEPYSMAIPPNEDKVQCQNQPSVQESNGNSIDKGESKRKRRKNKKKNQ